MKFLLDYGPLVAFFAAYKFFGIFTATAVLMVSLVLVAGFYRIWRGEWHKVHLISAVLGLIFGGLTLAVHDPRFIQFKPTALYAILSVALLGSHVFGDKVLMQRIPQTMIQMPDSTWRKVNFAWAMMFAVFAVLNLYIAYNFDEATWVKAKTIAFPILSFLFMLGHIPFVGRYLVDESASQTESGSDPSKKV